MWLGRFTHQRGPGHGGSAPGAIRNAVFRGRRKQGFRTRGAKKREVRDPYKGTTVLPHGRGKSRVQISHVAHRPGSAVSVHQVVHGGREGLPKTGKVVIPPESRPLPTQRAIRSRTKREPTGTSPSHCPSTSRHPPTNPDTDTATPETTRRTSRNYAPSVTPHPRPTAAERGSDVEQGPVPRGPSGPLPEVGGNGGE